MLPVLMQRLDSPHLAPPPVGLAGSGSGSGLGWLAFRISAGFLVDSRLELGFGLGFLVDLASGFHLLRF